jgi:hypothetical protein
MECLLNAAIWNLELAIFWARVSSLAAVAGVGVAAFTFWRSSKRMEETEQTKIVHDIRNNLFQAEDNILKLKSVQDKDDEDVRSRAIRYLNVCEWYSLLVNRNLVKMQELIDYFKPNMCDPYKNILGLYPDLKNDRTKFREFKNLCNKLECENL